MLTQGIDLEAGGRNKKTHRTAPKSENVYLKLLVKVGRSPMRFHFLLASRAEHMQFQRACRRLVRCVEQSQGEFLTIKRRCLCAVVQLPGEAHREQVQ